MPTPSQKITYRRIAAGEECPYCSANAFQIEEVAGTYEDDRVYLCGACGQQWDAVDYAPGAGGAGT